MMCREQFRASQGARPIMVLLAARTSWKLISVRNLLGGGAAPYLQRMVLNLGRIQIIPLLTMPQLEKKPVKPASWWRHGSGRDNNSGGVRS